MQEGNKLDSTCGISDEELTERFKASIKIDQDICKIKVLPIAGYGDGRLESMKTMIHTNFLISAGSNYDNLEKDGKVNHWKQYL